MPEINLLLTDDKLNQAQSAWVEFAKAVLALFREFLSLLVKQNIVSGRVAHLAQHTKKARVRKKNINRALRKFKKLMKVK